MEKIMRKVISVVFILCCVTLATSCGSSSSSGTTSAGSASSITATSGDGSVTIDTVTSTARSVEQTACTYNVYIASQSGVTNKNYQSLADGAMYENVTFPFTITGLNNNTTYYIVLYELCDGVETQVGSEVSATPTPPASDGGGGMTPESINVTSVTAGVEEVEVFWSAPSDFARGTIDYPTEAYRVCWEAGTNPDSSSPCDEVGRGENSYTATGLTGGTQYCFALQQRKDVIGDSDFGKTMCATPTSAPVVVTPTPTPALCAGDPLLAGFFPDALLQACIDAKGWTNASDANGTLNCNFRGIVNLTGLQCLTGLTQLILDSDNIVDVSPLSTLTNLTSLIMDSNNIVDVSPLATITNLTYLDVGLNNIGAQGVGKVDQLATLVNITAVNSLRLNGASNINMSCAELNTLIAAFTGRGEGDSVNPNPEANGTNCTNP